MTRRGQYCCALLLGNCLRYMRGEARIRALQEMHISDHRFDNVSIK